MSAAARGAPVERRAAILEAAIQLFGQYGYRRTSIDDIARAADISKGGVYLSFSSKEELFRALCSSFIERVESAVDRGRSAPGSFEDRLLAVLEAKFGLYFETVHRSPHTAELIDSKHRLSADLFAEADRRYHRVVRELIGAAVSRGEIDSACAGLKPAQAAELVIDAVRGIELGARDPAAYHRRLKELVHLIVAGLGRSASSMERRASGHLSRAG
jgi:TetR/AcrR family transcriptional regulator, regulator of autoinduction and epiphytic fitness